ncbi:ABC-three component system middle component 4 [Achromobacter ruhlandii]|uniref:ABC-three component system middle component 4 n=1 Tax=Achromobacter ruhlandii TaxID=72557 RepID=UPI00118770BF|nr:ABC-three component system middle component 4 [Achromobacter ruhlandii]MCZ8433915.1 hypothetical protein [Achromobacter ruhlandii]MDC6089055.1 hypothetical protein [Achromobacter ruhlandii]MDC6152308.1 hypothetical protein [Achromobacter ruhlandii]MDD7982414.1 hypothetical protein [Achromobacter ruhlandii]WIW03124.1 hypothetical protein PPH40_000440 [Achromobacter ruhlandii]
MKLPYRVPDNELTLNVAILLIIIFALGRSTRGKLLLNNERLRLFLYLLKNPIKLNELLICNEKSHATLQSHEEYSVASISNNADILYDDSVTKELLQYAAASHLLEVEYRKTDGFMYCLSPAGINVVNQLVGDYYDHLHLYANALAQLNAIPTSTLNEQADRIRRGQPQLNSVPALSLNGHFD